ncbi:putative coiled-coil domain-containing protein 195 [Pangasianodon hypophthalmus]|uniref:putative coiled-coil domain-containing protein 195 n=1 Tax=Pangasianodon hypophthalmus TaxID=310915 RepID=UPI002307CB60|nr:putative coiled-coil domain-containing protein 195 [Pangasianodon hypophthalmus]
MMESGCGLARVIQQLQDEIRKLETENKELRGQLSLPLTETSPTDSERRDGTTENHSNLRRNVSAPALEGQYKENMIMTVRRYSISSNAIHVPCKSVSSHKPRSDSDWARLRGGARTTSEDRGKTDDKPANRRTFQQCVNKARAKEKTVTFLLPVDDIYTNRPFMADHLTDTSSCDLQISETDS